MALSRILDILALPSVPDEGAELGDQDVGDGEGLAVEEVEAARDLAGDLDVGHVVLAHGHEVGARQEDVGGLEHGVAEEAEGHLLDAGALGHLLEARHAREARHGDEVLEEEGELADLGHGRLEVDDALGRVDAAGEVVEHVPRTLSAQGLDVLLLGLGGEGVEVGDDEEALVLVLEADAVREAADVVAEVELAGGAVAREYAFSVAHDVSPEWGRKQGNKETGKQGVKTRKRALLVSLLPVSYLLVYRSQSTKTPRPAHCQGRGVILAVPPCLSRKPAPLNRCGLRRRTLRRRATSIGGSLRSALLAFNVTT